ncbi:MAG: hypothetical protein RL077_1109, partial [Verrucomicrobiota bacterium]
MTCSRSHRSKLLVFLALSLGLSLGSLFAQTPPAAATPPPPPPTLEQRVAGLEAYLGNGDPTATLKVGPKDKDGNATIPAGLTT